MTYAVKELFLTLQGEGFHTGRRAVFVRFAGCNLWSGREQDRAEAQCNFCDTDFVGGERMSADEIAERVDALWGSVPGRFVVLTGGEPTLQVDEQLCKALYGRGFETAIETNGTRNVPGWISWICVSPKAGTEIVQKSGDEIKIVWPQPLDLDKLSTWNFRHFFIQPMDGPDAAANQSLAVEYCLAHPHWRLSFQAHKVLGIR